MRLIVWIHRDPSAPIEAGMGAPGEGWEQVGFIDSMTEHEIVKQVQARLGLNTSRPKVTSFYISADPDAAWLGDNPNVGSSFALALDPNGDGNFLRAAQPARIQTFNRRPPEPHPALKHQPRLIPIRLSVKEGNLFD